MPTALGIFIEKLQHQGLEAFGVFYGTYKGTVTRNDDPDGRGRIQAACPGVGQDEALNKWISPTFNAAGADHGWFWPPEVGDSVRVVFECGNADRPMSYIGGWYGKDDQRDVDDVPDEFVHSNNKPERRGVVTRGGHYLVFCDEPDNESIKLVWHKSDGGDDFRTDPTKAADRVEGEFSTVTLDKEGSILLLNKNGSMVNLDAKNGAISIIDETGNVFAMGSDGVQIASKDGDFIKVKNGEVTIVGNKKVNVTAPSINLKGGTIMVGDGASNRAVLGEKLLQWLNTHTHTAQGPTSPTTFAIPPAMPSILSSSVKVK